MFYSFDRVFIDIMRKYGVMVLRVSLGMIFFWFGALKIFGVSPVADMVADIYSFLPADAFFMFLGIWEVVVGVGLIFKIYLRMTLVLLWLQMGGTLFSFILAPAIFFQNGNILMLTMEGEFVMKNLVLIASGLVIGGYDIRPWREKSV